MGLLGTPISADKVGDFPVELLGLLPERAMPTLLERDELGVRDLFLQPFYASTHHAQIAPSPGRVRYRGLVIEKKRAGRNRIT